MKKTKLMFFLIAIFVLSSCSNESLSLQEGVLESNDTRAPAPKPNLIYSNDFCTNGPQVKLKFNNCHYSSTFFVNVFKADGTHVYSWPVDNPNEDYYVITSIGSTPFTFPDGSTTCSLLIEGESYFLSAGAYGTTGASASDTLYIPITGCKCTS